MTSDTRREIDLAIKVQDGWWARQATFNVEAGTIPSKSIITFEMCAEDAPDGTFIKSSEGTPIRAELDLPSGKFSELANEITALPVSRNINQSQLYAADITDKIMASLRINKGL